MEPCGQPLWRPPSLDRHRVIVAELSPLLLAVLPMAPGPQMGRPRFLDFSPFPLSPALPPPSPVACQQARLARLLRSVESASDTADRSRILSALDARPRRATRAVGISPGSKMHEGTCQLVHVSLSRPRATLPRHALATARTLRRDRRHCAPKH